MSQGVEKPAEGAVSDSAEVDASSVANAENAGMIRAAVSANFEENEGDDQEMDPFSAYGYTPLDHDGVDGSSDFYFAVPDGVHDSDDVANGSSVSTELADIVVNSMESEYDRTLEAAVSGEASMTPDRCEPSSEWRAAIEKAAKEVGAFDEVNTIDTNTTSTHALPEAPMEADHAASIIQIMKEMSLPTPPWEKEESIKSNANQREKEVKMHDLALSNAAAWKKMLESSLGRRR